VGWKWVSASACGTSHTRLETPRQDANRVVLRSSNKIFIAAVCDGAGTAEYGGQGAAIAARTFTNEIANSVKRSLKNITDQVIWDAVDLIRDQITIAAQKRDLVMRDFATTLVASISDGRNTITVHVGDGTIAGRLAKDGLWQSLSWPEHGEYASTTFFLTDTSEVKLRVSRFSEPIDRIVLMTDGLERLALDFAQLVPHAPFFAGISEPISAEGDNRGSPKLAKALQKYLDSPAINERTDDDKTLVIAAL
jgi:serine/threonine protein phosphatase PrpC